MTVQNRKLKVFLITCIITLFFVFLTSQLVYAETYNHGDYTSNSQTCGSCHLTHGAQTAMLLAYGPTETDFCYFCHGKNSMGRSNYDVETGIVTGNDGVKRPSYAGGFMKSVDPSKPETVNGQVYTYENTSVHSIEKACRMGTISEQVNGDIPGGMKSWTGSFTCGSCHDPHAGGKYPSTPYRNPRLLRKTLLDETVRTVYMSIDYSNTNLPLAYGAGFNQWCGGCHDLFNTEGAERTGSTAFSYHGMDMFRHKVGVYIPDRQFSTSLLDGLPIPTDTKGQTEGTPQWRLDCLTCHRAHGTSVNVSVGFKRFERYNSVDSYSDDQQQSALLRLPEREACYKCHGSAEFNVYGDDDTYIPDYQNGW